MLDLKAYEGEVHGAEEGEWQVIGPDGTTVPLKTNLFHQLRTHRFDLANRLLRIREAAFPQIEEKDLMKVGAWGYFKRGSTYPEGQIDLDRVKWFDIVTADTLAERLMLVDAGFTIGEREMDAIMGALHLAPSGGLVPAANGIGARRPRPGQRGAAGPDEPRDGARGPDGRARRADGGDPGGDRGARASPARPAPAAAGAGAPGAEIPGGCTDAVGPDESDAPLAERIRRFVCERYAAPARREGRRSSRLTSGQVHREMGLANRMPSVCGALRGRRLEERCGIELVEEVRSVRVRENSATNRFVYRVKEGVIRTARPSCRPRCCPPRSRRA